MDGSEHTLKHTLGRNIEISEIKGCNDDCDKMYLILYTSKWAHPFETGAELRITGLGHSPSYIGGLRRSTTCARIPHGGFPATRISHKLTPTEPMEASMRALCHFKIRLRPCVSSALINNGRMEVLSAL